MKIYRIRFVAAFTLLISSGICYSQTVDTPYVVATWHGFCQAAVSFTFDDGCSNQFPIAIPMFDAKKFHLTLFTVVTGGMFPGWAKLDTAAAHGHEIASHTMTHTSMGGMAAATQITELKNSKDSINKYVPGKQCITMAYPNCSEGTDSICAKYYLAARICSGQIVSKSPTNFYSLSSFVCGSQGNNSTATINALANNAVSSNGWCVYLFHSIDNDGGYSPVASTTLQGCVNYMDTSRSKFWVETFGNVARYIKERNAAAVKGVSRTADTITLQVTDALNDTIFDYPITVRRPLPSGWQTVKVTQGAATLTAQTRDSNAVKYVLFDAVPDKGNIVITRNVTGVQNALCGAAVSSAVVWFAHKNLTFSVPASAGMKLAVALYNLKGARIANFKVTRKGGEIGSVRLPAAVVKSGMYIVKISDGKSLWSNQCFSQ